MDPSVAEQDALASKLARRIARPSRVGALSDNGNARTPPASKRAKLARGEFLSRKFRLPSVPSPWFLRDRLDPMLTDALKHPLTLVTGPPGAGKTVMLAAWAVRHSDRRVAYVALDVTDNDPLAFWRTLSAALRRFEHEPTAEPEGTGVWAVLELVRQVPTLVLVLDDFHLIRSSSLVSDLGVMIKNLPDHIRVVISSREDPPIALHRMRVAGDLAEIRQDDLRFDFAEGLDYLEMVSGKKISPDVARRLVERTEGWAVGLQIAALLLREEHDAEEFTRRFAGDAQVIAGYLTQEVLDNLPDRLYRFLMLTSVLDQMSAPLCRRVTGYSDAGDILDELVSRHLFIYPMDAEHRWYRYHRLFGQLLRHIFSVRNPDAMYRAHARAGEWYETHGNPQAAIHHFVQAQAYDRAFRLAGDCVVGRLELAVVGNSEADFEPELMTSGLDEIPIDFLRQDRLRLFALTLDLLLSARLPEGEMWLARLTRSNSAVPRWLEVREELLWTLRAWLVADAGEVVRHANRGAPYQSEPPPVDVLNEHPWLARLDGAFGSAMSVLAARGHLWLGDYEAVRRSLGGLSSEPESFKCVIAPGLLAVAAAREGRLVESQQLAAAALEMAHPLGLAARSSTYAAHYALALTSLERDDLGQAEQRVVTACEYCRELKLEGWVAGIELDLVRVLMSQRRFDEAFAVISRLRVVEAAGRLPGHVRRSLDLLEIRWRLTVGDLEGATGLLDRLPAGAKPVALEARAHLVAGRPDRAVAMLAEAQRPHSSSNLLQDLKHLVLLAHARLQMGSPRQARDAVRRALDLARGERHIRVFIDEGDDIRWLLESLETRFPDPYLSEVIAHGQRAKNGSSAPEPGTLVEGLTDRERATLTRLPSHLTQQQIAADMYVSVNTLKTHLKSLYRKLGATTRAEAVTAARAHGLL